MKHVVLVAALFACRSPQDVRVLRAAGDGPRILCVTAHPDDEIAFAGVLYKTATLLDGRCDVVVVTNGEGGFKYSTLAEEIYGLELTDEEVGRRELPRIRRDELVAGCALLGVHSVRFLGQRDHRYTLDPFEVLAPDAGVWDLERVGASLEEVLADGDYDFVLVLAPTPGTHGHHKAAGILALRAVADLPASERPAVLCVRSAGKDDEPPTYDELEGFPETRPTGVRFTFDRTQKFGYRDALDYRVVANLAIAAHRSQGTMQLLVNEGEVEHYFLFAGGPPDGEERARALFEALRVPQFAAREYGESAGVGTR